MSDNDKVIGSVTGQRLEGDNQSVYVVAGFNIGTGASDPDEKGNKIPCVVAALQSANNRPPMMLILPEYAVESFMHQLSEARGRMIRENPRKGR